MGCLYQISFPNGKAYIGITTKTLEHRFKGHCCPTGDRAIHNAIKKYGIGAAKISTLVIANDWGYLQELERNAIRVFNTKAPHGYNLTDGGEGVLGLQMSAKAREKMAQAKKGKPSPKRGIPLSEAQKEKLRVANLGKKQSAETIRKRTAWQAGKARDADFCAKVSAGKKAQNFKFSDESRAKMSASHLGKKQSPEAVAKRKATIAVRKAAGYYGRA